VADLGFLLLGHSLGNEPSQAFKSLRDEPSSKFETLVDLLGSLHQHAFFLLLLRLWIQEHFSPSSLLDLLFRLLLDDLLLGVYLVFVFEIALLLKAGEDSVCILIDFDDPLIFGVFFEVEHQRELGV
jgi:hypothetical protein